MAAFSDLASIELLIGIPSREKMGTDINFLMFAEDPLVQTGVLALVGALFTHFALRNRPTHRFAGQLFFFIALTVLLFYHGVVPYDAGTSSGSVPERVFTGLARMIWWTNGALSLVGFVRAFLTFERRTREGRLLQDLVIGMIYVGTALSIAANVFSFPVGTVIATSGIFAIIVGLAMQSTLSNVFSGIALNISRPYAIGDWISLGDGIEGQVLETNWRATHLLSDTNDLIILPNSSLAKANLTNLSGPDRSHGVAITIRILPTVSPGAVTRVMQDVLLSCTSILPSPAPTTHIHSLDADAIEVKLSFHVAKLSAVGKTKDEVFDLVYRHVKSSGMKFASPSASLQPVLNNAESSASTVSTPLRLLNAIPLFTSLTEDEKEALATTMSRRTFRKGDVVVEQGSVLAALAIVRTGVLAVTSRDGEEEIETGRLAPGDFFGEGGLLTGAGASGTVRALTFVVVYEIALEHLAPLIHDRPSIAEELGAALLYRKQSVDPPHPIASEEHRQGSVARLAARIRGYVHRPSGN
ncbi:mechanosensitive ion channel family protein [Azospirillum sp. B506]|uniref:mechanosensitive ion channel family protein n=1 Tax=Azospirillum sp. B506 TaxID=137721 RepID=UPI00190022B6|nr:mechanosensitive ion channel family protein [Azospirillum sp. B506]